ncbi:MAG: nucleotidyltransferase substrate binding protein [Candidatus Latescibacterota bacterium]
MLDLSSLIKASNALEIALEIYSGSPLPDAAPEKVVLRDGVIQRFEFTFELSWKMLKRFLEMYGLERVDSLISKELFRAGFEQGLIDDPERWFHYIRMRNQTSHAYNEQKAREVFEAAKEFLPDVKHLLRMMKEKMM